jgi:hypothetical protein
MLKPDAQGECGVRREAGSGWLGLLIQTQCCQSVVRLHVSDTVGICFSVASYLELGKLRICVESETEITSSQPAGMYTDSAAPTRDVGSVTTC